MNFAVASAGVASQQNAAAQTATPQAAQAAAAGSAEHRRLLDAAQQFEGMLLQEMMKPMREHGFGQEEDDAEDGEGTGGYGDTLASFGVEAASTAIARAGGLGIAKQVVAQVEREETSRSPAGAGAAPEFQNPSATVLKSAATPPMN